MKNSYPISKLNMMANAIRILSIDTIQLAKSGHPGMPMGMADISVALWNKHFCHNPKNPKWINRDRFVISNGHGSMLLYSLLHLTGYDLSIKEIKNFRKLNSMTPGHPEYGITPGVEATTGPLGQGLANAVGMAIAESLLSNEFNKKDLKIIDHYTYVFCGDGCLMEGISHEACSLAGVLKLKKLIVFYDDNNISIDGEVSNWFKDNTPKRFKSYNWNVIENINGHDIHEIDLSIQNAKKSDKPTLICCKTIIGKGSPNKSGKNIVHGAPLGDEEIIAVRKKLKWNYLPFIIPNDIYEAWDHKKIGQKKENEWNNKFKIYEKKYQTEAKELIRRNSNELPVNWKKKIKELIINIKKQKLNNISTRQSSKNIIEEISKILVEFLGGSADLSSSNLTKWNKAKSVHSKNGVLNGNYINYGVREFGMSAIINGIMLHKGYKAFGGTFLAFSDYSRNALRMAALMKIPSIFLFTHDSIGLGEDGPTHQPIEHISSLRLIPNLNIWRPSNTIETAVAWKCILENKYSPSCLILTRQELKEYTINNTKDISYGGYILLDWDNIDNPKKIILISTGSEISIAMSSVKKIIDLGISVRVVSIPSTSVFDIQNNDYKKKILPNKIPKITIEAGSTCFWKKYIKSNGYTIGINKFGESASESILFKHFNLTVEKIISLVIKIFKKYK